MVLAQNAFQDPNALEQTAPKGISVEGQVVGLVRLGNRLVHETSHLHLPPVLLQPLQEGDMKFPNMILGRICNQQKPFHTLSPFRSIRRSADLVSILVKSYHKIPENATITLYMGNIYMKSAM